MKLFSIITVCFNAEATIESTIESIFSQTSYDYELVVVDGKSTDSTLQIIDKAIEKYHKEDVVSIKSEMDNGIYDAMNKGVQRASGNYSIFLNSGDTFYDRDVLKKVSSIISDEKYDLIYGNTMVIYPKFSVIRECNDLSIIDTSLDMPYCHQSVFIKSDVLKSNIFDLKYTDAADYGQCVSLYKETRRYKKTNTIISNYQIGGRSEQREIIYFEQKLKVREEFGYYLSNGEKKRLMRNKKIRVCMKKIIPETLLMKIRFRIYKNNLIEDN